MLIRLNDSGLFVATINSIRTEESGVPCEGVMHDQVFRLRKYYRQQGH